MGQTIKIPSVLRSLTSGQEAVQLEAATVRQALAALEQRYPGFRNRLFDPQGELNRFILIYINNQEVTDPHVLDAPLGEGDEIIIVPALAGGVIPPSESPGASERRAGSH